MKKTIDVMICCNDRNGGFLRSAAWIEVGDRLGAGPFLDLEGDPTDPDPFVFDGPSGRFLLAGCRLQHLGRARYVGNIHWDRFTFPVADVVALIDRLRTLPHWQCVEATEGLFDRWREGPPFTEADLLEADKP